MTTNEPLNCLKCPSLCCKVAGYVEVSRNDIRRLAKHLELSVPAFEEKHIVEVTRKGKKRIKSGFRTCQFLGADRRCTVYHGRPKDCRQYVCWNDDPVLYDTARFLQMPLAKLRKTEEMEEA